VLATGQALARVFLTATANGLAARRSDLRQASQATSTSF
jgi:hypothetical protein